MARAWGPPLAVGLSLIIAGGGFFAVLGKRPIPTATQAATSARATEAARGALDVDVARGATRADPAHDDDTSLSTPVTTPDATFDPTAPLSGGVLFDAADPFADSDLHPFSTLETGEASPPEPDDPPTLAAPEEDLDLAPAATHEPLEATSPGDEDPLPEPEPAVTLADAEVSPSSARGKVNCSKAKCVALTFDDGPSPNTKAVLKVLADRDIKATFFVLGSRVQAYPKIIKRIAEAGHVIGNHSWSHSILTRMSAKQITREIARTSKAVKKAVGVEPTLVRPPYGIYNERVSKLADAPIILWDVDTRDWETKSRKTVLSHVKHEVSPGSIILMHDPKKRSVKFAASVIDYLQKKGYVFVTVPELLGKAKSGKVYRSG